MCAKALRLFAIKSAKAIHVFKQLKCIGITRDEKKIVSRHSTDSKVCQQFDKGYAFSYRKYEMFKLG